MAEKKKEEEAVEEVKAEEAKSDRIDETVPGGKYIVGGQVVNAEGKALEGFAIDDKGEVVEKK